MINTFLYNFMWDVITDLHPSFILTNFSLLAAPEVATSGAANNEKFINMTALLFQFWFPML